MVEAVDEAPVDAVFVERGGVFIAFGSNMGDREAHIRGALRDLAAYGDIAVLQVSSLIETVPVGGPPNQQDYLNAVAELRTDLTPQTLLARLNAIEAHHGRVRLTPNGPRTLDLDLLLFRDRVIDEADLSVPHPRMWSREFVMEPLAEICSPTRLAAYRALASPDANSA